MAIFFYMRKLVPLYDGRVALLSIAGEGGMSLQYVDTENGRLVKLADWESLEGNIWYVTLLDEETLLYADKEGIYRSPRLMKSIYSHIQGMDDEAGSV
ncbi:MAG: hypothetical protein HFH85_18755 [Lachnospiraceae bacterium]|nr:hypothetical protein [Lachnospiraceae bacterium]